ncbi:thioredoxin-like 3-2, chloroplastic isoform X2 [Bidens hawaiensis]|uniref:thioredoxin-like 3-2, chloroplastic isoform X2 n=1 Tax=Bidens hawaiensis TaxID=980011 RepID=UPI00404AFD42
MSDATRLLPISPLQTPNSLFHPPTRLSYSTFRSSRIVSDSSGYLKLKEDLNSGCLKVLANLSQQGSISAIDSSSSSSPVSIELKPVLNESQFDRVVSEGESVVVLWMANWCRKCIYLKPKLEKLAANYHPRVKFYCIDVNNVPYQLVARAGVTKMPTIQLWKNGKKQAEVIGGHKAYLVANEVRDMIDDEGQP